MRRKYIVCLLAILVFLFASCNQNEPVSLLLEQDDATQEATLRPEQDNEPQEIAINEYEAETKALLDESMAVLIDEMHKTAEFANSQSLHTPVSMYIAFADISGDGIPEFFYGHHSLTSMQSTVWYRVYSLTEKRQLAVAHDDNWSTYLMDDVECGIAANPDWLFNEKYYVDESGAPYYMLDYYAGSAQSPRMEAYKLQYDESAAEWRLQLTVTVSKQYDKDRDGWEVRQIDHLETDRDQAETILWGEEHYVPFAPDDASFPFAESFGEIDQEDIESSVYAVFGMYCSQASHVAE